jgi:hypothetical protein
MSLKRYALIIAPASTVANYLPSNYEVKAELQPEQLVGVDDERFGSLLSTRTVTVIEGRDDAGWTLDAYVFPRLASGLYAGREIDLSHDVMKRIPA